MTWIPSTVVVVAVTLSAYRSVRLALISWRARRESFVLDVLTCENRRVALCCWADERRMAHHVALRRFERPEQPGDIVATRTMLGL